LQAQQLLHSCRTYDGYTMVSATVPKDLMVPDGTGDVEEVPEKNSGICRHFLQQRATRRGFRQVLAGCGSAY